MQGSQLKSLLGIGFLAQEPPRRPLGIPWWVWVLLFVVVIVVAIIWVLREKEEKAAPVKGELEAPPEAEAGPVEEAVPTKPEAESAPVAAEEPEAAAAEAEVGAAAVAAAAVVAAEEPEAVEEAAPAEAEVGAAAVAAAAVAAAEEPEAVEPDDLQRIEGIGPKISGLLQAVGITTYAQLAETDVSRLQGILDEAGISRIANPSSWPEQARLAAAGNWAALAALQDRLKGGRQVRPDNFQRIEGIGPKIARVLQAAGITSFAQLADTDADRLRQVLEEADLARLTDPSTWPEQARLAADGDWTGLQALQGQLKGGRRVES